MSVTGEQKTIKDEGGERNAFVVTFTNGALEQLNQLKEYFNLKEIGDVITIGVSFLQKAKENAEKEKKEGQVKPDGK